MPETTSSYMSQLRDRHWRNQLHDLGRYQERQPEQGTEGRQREQERQPEQENMIPTTSSPRIWEPAPPITTGQYTYTPKNFSYGIELETSTCPGYEALHGQTVFGCKDEPSVAGMEFYSPIFMGDEGLKHTSQLCEAMVDLGCEVNDSCGYHLHLGVGSVSSQGQLAIAYAYILTEDFWRSLIPPERRDSSYCSRIRLSREDLRTAEASDEFFEGYNRLSDILSCGERCGIHFGSYSRFKTFEIRLHQGTIEANKVRFWILAHLKFVQWASLKSFRELEDLFTPIRSQPHAVLGLMDGIWNDKELSYYYYYKLSRFSREIK